MKRIFLTVIIAAVGICAWCENITVTFTAQSGSQSDDCVSVGVTDKNLYWSDYKCWRLPECKTNYKFLEVEVLKDAFQKGCRISKVEFTLSSLGNSDYFNNYLVPQKILLTCFNASQATVWEKSDYYNHTCTYYKTPDADPMRLLFCATISELVNVTNVTITYHKHSAGESGHHAAVPGTCGTKGTIEYWECECGKKFSDSNLTAEVTSIEGELDPDNHVKDDTKHTDAIQSTCSSHGTVEYWTCLCGEKKLDANGVILSSIETPFDPDNHSNLTEVAGIASTCTSTGILHHWHCDGCGKDFKDEEATVDITGSISTPRKEPDAVTVTQTAEDDYSYMLEDGVRFTFDGDNVYTTVNGQDKPGFTLSETVAIRICPARTFKLKANQDPDNTSNYYSTFYTSEGAYKVPETAKAYIGEVKTGEKTDVLKLTDVGTIIHQSEAVMLKATGSDITLMPSCNKDSASTENALEGTDKEKTLTTNQYALSLGQNGVGFYLWEGKSIGANKAYLTLPSTAKALTFEFSDEPSGIKDTFEPYNRTTETYNLNGMRVGKDYKGIIVVHGKKFLKK